MWGGAVISERILWRSISELTIAEQLRELADREPLENFAPWAVEMSRNLSARERAENPDPFDAGMP
jgi:hypothetical protein